MSKTPKYLGDNEPLSNDIVERIITFVIDKEKTALKGPITTSENKTIALIKEYVLSSVDAEAKY